MMSLKKRNQIYQIFQSAINDPKALKEVVENRYSLTNSTMMEFSNSNLVSDGVFSPDMPVVEAPNKLMHFTTFKKFQNIISSRKLHLSQMKKRFNGGEFKTFAEDCDLDGYLDTSQKGVPFYDELMEDLFFASFFSGPTTSPGMWWTFGGRYKGVCLVFSVSPSCKSNLREVMYGPSPKGRAGRKPTFEAIDRKLNSEIGVRFVPHGISRLCGFYLPRKYKHQRETRLILKRFINRGTFPNLPSTPNGPDPTIEFDGRPVWPVEIIPHGGTSGDQYCKIKLLKVIVGKLGDIDQVRGILDNSTFSSVPCGQESS